MNKQEVMKALQLDAVPNRWEGLYEQAMHEYEKMGVPYIQPGYIDLLNQRYPLFTEYMNQVLQAAELAQKNEALTRYLHWVVYAMRDRTHFRTEIKDICAPQHKEGENSAPYDFFLMLALLETIPRTIQSFKDRKIPEDVIKDTLRGYEAGIDLTYMITGTPGLSFSRYISWMQWYVDALILKVGCLNFNVRTEFGDKAVVFQNRLGERKLLMRNVMLYEGGRIFGSAGLDDEQKAYDADYVETDEYCEGYEALESGYAASERTKLKKSEWKIVLEAGDAMIDVHIPSAKHGGRLSEEECEKTYKRARKVFTAGFPEYDFKGFCCTSWLLDPQLQQFLPKDSGIVRFQKRFIQYPYRSPGRSVFSFVFLKPFDSYRDLPETTSLMRAIKQHYLDGGYIYDHSGVIL